MMAAYQPTPGVHPGLAHGHPGMPQGAVPHMGQPMQMHPGMSGAPHVSQPAMVGMQPGAQGMGAGGMGGQHPGGMPMQHMGGQAMPGGMPNAQAMGHVTPQQQMQMQQAAQMQANPQHVMRMRQQQMMAAQQSGMMGGMQPGMQLSPQQFAHLQQQQQQHQQVQGGGQGVQLSQHLIQQQLAIQQHQMQQRAQQHSQMAQQMAMQHANSQQSNQGQPTAQSAQPQPNPQVQMRPQSRMANPSEQAQPGQQPPAQQNQGQQGQPQPQQIQQPGQQANQQPGQQQQPMTMQQQQVRAQQYALLQQRQQQFAAQQQFRAAQAQAQPGQGTQSGMFILRLMNFSDHLSNFNETNGRDISNWHNFVERHFANEGRLIHSFDVDGKPHPFEVLRATVARYFWTYFDSGASSLRLHVQQAREVPHPTGAHQVACQHATFTISYPNGARLEMNGSLQVLYAANSDLIEWFKFQTTGTEEILSRSQVEKVVTEWSPPPQTKSPKMAKNKLPKAQLKMQEQQQQQDRLTIHNFPKTPKGDLGIASKVQQFLEIGETMTIMSDLMHCAQEKKLRPEQAMEALNQQYETQQQTQANGVAQNTRTPSMQNMQMGQQGNFSSPSMSNMQLPNGMNGSPHTGHNPGGLQPGTMNMSNSHTPSPHLSNMAAPPMMPQHSQQGTNSSAASANTSPNINNNNKRRRSTVKLEDGDGGGGDNKMVKPSPRMPKKSKPGS